MAYRLRLQELLNEAVEQGEISAVKSLVDQGAEINSVPWGMESVLMRALRCKQKEVAKYLIDNGVDIGYHYSAKEYDDLDDKFKATAREYAEFYKLPEIVTLIDQKTGKNCKQSISD